MPPGFDYCDQTITSGEIDITVPIDRGCAVTLRMKTFFVQCLSSFGINATEDAVFRTEVD